MPLSLKCVLVGDGAVGKTSLLITYTTGNFPTNYVPTVFDNYSAKVKVDDQEIQLGLWDTAGREDYDRLRPLSYPQTDVFLICYSLSSPASFQNIKTKWYPEINHHCPEAAYVLVGLKEDLLSNPTKLKYPPPTDGEINKLFEEINAYDSVKCSSLMGSGVQQVFEAAIRCALSQRRKQYQKKRKCQIL